MTGNDLLALELLASVEPNDRKIAEAVAAERERCAAICRKVADDHYSAWAEVCETRIRCAAALIDREGQTPCLPALASGDACQPDESLKRCTICGFVVDTKFAAAQPTVRMRP